jgi:hypothetical protein
MTTTKKTSAGASAEAFVRGVLVNTLGQKVDEKTLKSVATKVAKAATLEPSEVPERKRA